jgi:hypothetical protein
MARTRPVSAANRRTASRAKSVLSAVATIAGSTAVSFLIADAYLSVDRYRRSVLADLHGVMNWFAGLDPLMVAGIVAVTALIGIVLVARRMA